MRRDPALVPLSREHHRCLALARLLRHADDETAPTVHEALRAFLADEGFGHFTIEELLLLRALLSADPDSRTWADRLLYEHDSIRILAEDLAYRETAPVSELRRLGELIHDNVRGEEWELFPHVETTLGAAQLAELAPAIRAALPDTAADETPDEAPAHL